MKKKTITHIGNDDRCETCFNDGYFKAILDCKKIIVDWHGLANKKWDTRNELIEEFEKIINKCVHKASGDIYYSDIIQYLNELKEKK